MAEGMYQADGTIHVRFGGDESVVTFIPEKYVEQGGSRFVVFVPWEGDGQKSNANGDGKGKARKSDCEVEIDGLVAKACGSKGVPLHVENRRLVRLYLEAAVRAIKVTVLVSHGHRKLKLEEVVVPAIPAKPAT